MNFSIESTSGIIKAVKDFNAREVSGWTPREFANLYGGSKAKAAQALGITTRAFQRYTTTGAEKRTPSKAVQERMKILTPKEMSLTGYIVIGSPPGRDRTIPVGWSLVFGPSAWNRMTEAAADGDEETCWRMVAEAYEVTEDLVMENGTITIT